MVDVIHDRCDQLADALEDATTNSSIGDVAEPAFDNVQPRTARRSEVYMKAFVSLEPRLHFRMLVRCVVVHDQVQVEIARCFPVNLLQKLQPLLVPVLRAACIRR